MSEGTWLLAIEKYRDSKMIRRTPNDDNGNGMNDRCRMSTLERSILEERPRAELANHVRYLTFISSSFYTQREP